MLPLRKEGSMRGEVVRMYQLFALLNGGVISVMVMLNGQLASFLGAYEAAAVIHVVGVVFAGTLCLLGRKRVWVKAPLWAYAGGAIGVLSTLFNNFAFGHISMTSIVALSLLGQTITSTCLDHFGWLGSVKRPLNASLAVGLACSAAGIAVMLGGSLQGTLPAILFSIGAGVTVVLSRGVNGVLAARTGALAGSFINHLVGLPICLVLAAVLGTGGAGGEIMFWSFCGGMLGVVTVSLFNITVPRLPALQVTLCSFVGQIFTGLLLDLVWGKGLSAASAWGGILVAAGVVYIQVRPARTKEQ